MTITQIKDKLETSTHPIAKSLHQGPGYKVLIIGFKKGMILKDHKAHIRSKLTVLEGSVRYFEDTRIVTLGRYDEIDIPVEKTHNVEALEDSLCLLSQGD
ncbi:hypothetical protein [uncultured Cytophaga sp.]|uniref:hypothetical protein n=1 Tax=uncultured Cytophaga sp. TaxID=160238 RepID=UPI00260BC754|nr:hypothetical protein [uncultured Cytophaga sp.]